MTFSIITVCFNAGEELKKTVDSVLTQSYPDVELIVQDGGSTDGSLQSLPADPRIRVVSKKDNGIYDAMNRALQRAQGRYLLFLNCGDYLYDKDVLLKTAREAALHPADILYGDLYRRIQNSTDVAPDRITDFVCYRNVPCHQVCFYHKRLFAERGYDWGRYPVRADYEHFLYSYYVKKATTYHLPLTVSSYAGAGYSETKEHMAAAKEEHRKITAHYQKHKAFLYRLLMILTLQPLRYRLAQSRHLSGFYHKCKGYFYGNGGKR